MGKEGIIGMIQDRRELVYREIRRDKKNLNRIKTKLYNVV